MTANNPQRRVRYSQGVGLVVVLKRRSVYITDPIRKALIAMSNTIHIVTQYNLFDGSGSTENL
jgi:hypothetical protein